MSGEVKGAEMIAFTAYIDRNTNRKVTITASTAARAREYATSRYGKVEKLKVAPTQSRPIITQKDLSRLRSLQEGNIPYKDKIRKLQKLGLIDELLAVTEFGHSALASQPPTPQEESRGEG